MIRKTTIDQLADAIQGLENYHKDIRELFGFIEIRFRLQEYGVKLVSLSSNQLYSNASGYKLSDDSDYPFYLWTPSWLGRFYIDPSFLQNGEPAEHCPIQKVPLISFVWAWHGSGDAYVKDTQFPECWIGVAQPESDTPTETVSKVADTIFKQFRLESTQAGESQGWIYGNFNRNVIGCNLNGSWYLRRIPMSELKNFFDIEQNIIKPLGQKYHALKQELPLFTGA